MLQSLLARDRERVARHFDTLNAHRSQFLTKVALLQDALDKKARGSNVYRFRRKAG